MICPKCGFTEAKNEIKSVPLIDQSGASLKIVESEKGPSALPTTNIDWSQMWKQSSILVDVTDKIMPEATKPTFIDVLNVATHGEIMHESYKVVPELI